jgi:hypothetical protein
LQHQITGMGGDPQARSALARLAQQESSGIEDVILDGDPDIGHKLHALLVAELADNAGWQLLVDLADEAGDRAAHAEFSHRLREEEEHLSFTRRAVERLLSQEVLPEEVALPAPGEISS